MIDLHPRRHADERPAWLATSTTVPKASRTHLRALIERFRASAWAPVMLRLVLVGAGLLVLAWIGRTAATAQASGLRLASDAGASVPGPSASEVRVTAPDNPPPVFVAALPPAATPAGTGTPPPQGRATPSDPVYVNHASAEELRRLPGVGPKRAEAIVALRARVGRFQRVEDLLRVKGVGRSTLRKWRPLLRLDAPPRAVDLSDAGRP